MADLDDLLEAAKAASPSTRIDYRNRIAVYGSVAIPPLSGWLRDERLSPFAVRTLEKIADDPAARSNVVAALQSVDLAAASETAARDITEALTRLGVSRRPAARARSLGSTPAEWTGLPSASALEREFHGDMLDIFRLAGEATRQLRPDGTVVRGYWASYFLRGVRNHGGPEYARQLLRKAGTTPGFERLREEGRLDLTVEALVLQPKYVRLFTQEERRIAAHRLAEAGFQPRADS
jgi:hypothetical protein